MRDLNRIEQDFIDNGFAVIEHVFSDSDIEAIINSIERADTSNATFRKSSDLFAIR